MTWDEANYKFTPAEAYPIPSKFDWDGLPEHIDFGHKRFVIMNYMNCAAVQDSASQDHDDDVVITNPSAQFFEYAMLSGVQDPAVLDTNSNDLLDSSEYACDLDGDADGVLEAICGTDMDYTYGWTCRDLTATQTVTLSDAVDAANDGTLDGVWNVCEGLTGAEAEAAGYGWCNNVWA